MRTLISRFERDSVDADSSKLLLLGDLIDRGPDSIGAIDAAIEAGKRDFSSKICLMGNHEQMLKLALQEIDESDIELWIYNGGNSLTNNSTA